MAFEEGFRADLVIADKVIVELKSVDAVADVHKKQLLTYLRLADKRLGLLVNVGAARIKDGITRIVNGLPDWLPWQFFAVLCVFAPLRDNMKCIGFALLREIAVRTIREQVAP